MFDRDRSEDDEEYLNTQDLSDQSIIPGDNDKPSDEKIPGTDAPINLNKIPDANLPSPEDLGGN